MIITIINIWLIVLQLIYIILITKFANIILQKKLLRICTLWIKGRNLMITRCMLQLTNRYFWRCIWTMKLFLHLHVPIGQSKLQFNVSIMILSGLCLYALNLLQIVVAIHWILVFHSEYFDVPFLSIDCVRLLDLLYHVNLGLSIYWCAADLI